MNWKEDPKMARIYGLIAIAILVSSVSRGFDYIIRPAQAIPFTQGVESAAPLWIWGTLLIFFGVLGLCGETWYHLGTCKWRWIPSFLAHSALAAILGVIGFSIVVDGIYQGWGWASGASLAVLAFVHFLCGYRRRDANK